MLKKIVTVFFSTERPDPLVFTSEDVNVTLFFYDNPSEGMCFVSPNMSVSPTDY